MIATSLFANMAAMIMVSVLLRKKIKCPHPSWDPDSQSDLRGWGWQESSNTSHMPGLPPPQA